MDFCYLVGHNFKENTKAAGRWESKYICSRCEVDTNHPESNKFHDTFWDSEAFYTIRLIGGILLIIALIVSLIVYFVNIGQQISCNEYGKLGIDVIYSFWTGCMAKHPVYGYIPLEDYFRIVNLFVK